MKINFHDLQTQYLNYQNEIDLAIKNVLSSGQFIMGEAVSAFESSCAHYLHCQHFISCANGTDALLLALMAFDIQPGDEVITTPFTFIATAEVINFLGAKVVFADIDPDTYLISPHEIEAKINANTRAIIPVSLFGQPADMDEINQIALHYGSQYGHKIYVIEDAAQSFGASYKDSLSGNLSDIACFSFFPTKPLGCYGDGGALATNDDLVAEKIKSLRIHGQTRRYEHKYIGINSRLDAMQAAILQVKLKYFAAELRERHQIANYYSEQLGGFDVALPFVKPDRTSVYAQYSIRVKEREKMMAFLNSKDIPTVIHYPKPLHLQTCFAHLNYVLGDFPIAEKVSSEILSLPMSAFVTEVQLKYIVKHLQAFLTYATPGATLESIKV